MMRSIRLMGVLVVGACALATGQAAAQAAAPADRGYVNVNVGTQAGSHDLGQQGSFDQYDETGTFTSKVTIGGSPIFDIGGGVRVFGRLFAGVSFTRASDTSNADVTGSVPHPFYYDQFRSVTGQASGLKHAETAIHVQAVYRLPITTKFDVALSAGPTFFSVEQDVVKAITIAEQGSPTTGVVMTGAEKEKIKENAVGFNVGLDGTFMFSHSLGAGAFLRYTGGSVDLDATAGKSKLDVGGLQIGAGLRLRF
jgi:hypothetical protein